MEGLSAAGFSSFVLTVCLILTAQTAQAGSVFKTTPNAPHIFNAVHSSMRQWGSSLNHNGMSYFIATVPRGTQVYHGTDRSEPIIGMEWLALEPEHAMMFAHRFVRPSDASSLPIEMRTKLSWTEDVFENSYEEPLQVRLGSPPRRAPQGEQPKVEPGYLQTYAVNKDLRLLYIDGQSAAKTSKGTLDSQEHIILRNTTNGTTAPWWDYQRGKALCHLAKDRWHSKIDGYLRMESGFEIILCDFSNLVQLRATRTKPSGGDDGHRERRLGMELISLFKAVAARYGGIGGERVRLDYEHFVSAYAYPDLDLFENLPNLPRLANLSESDAAMIFNDLETLIMNIRSTETPKINWQSIADEIVERYGRKIPYLISQSLHNKTALAAEIEQILEPFIDYDSRDTTLEIQRCTNNFIPQILTVAQKQSLAAKSITVVSGRICSTLHSAMNNHTSYHDAVSQIQDLIDYLAWPIWKYCNPECKLDEVCMTAIWPFGSKEDHYHPSCHNWTTIQAGRSYWNEDWRKS